MSGRHVREGVEPDARPVTRPTPAHAATGDHNGDPVCVCGWDPARELWPGSAFNQVDALHHVYGHVVLEARQDNPRTPPAD